MTTTRETLRDEACAILRTVHTTAALESARFKDIKARSQRLDSRIRELRADLERFIATAEAGQTQDPEPMLSGAAELRAVTADVQRLSAELVAWEARYDAFAASVQTHLDRLCSTAAEAGLDFDAIDEEARLVLAQERKARAC